MGVLTQWNGSSDVPALQSADGHGIWKLGSMVARSLVMQRLFSRLRHAAPHLRIVTLEGEPGTGKMLTAQTLHALGPASGAPFVASAASRFAAEDVQALLDEVRGGTLFLTRVSELTTEQQSRFFDFLEWWEHRSVHESGGFLPRQIFVASQQSLRQLASRGSLRSDLTYRLTAIRFILPPLRERREDIAGLANHFAVKYGAMRGKTMRGLGPGSLQRLMAYNWPGNVRELETVITNAVMECEGQWIRPIDLPALVSLPQAALQLPVPIAARQIEDDPNLDRMILRHIRTVLEKTGGNKLRTAQLLGISRSTLYRLLEPQDGLKNSIEAQG